MCLQEATLAISAFPTYLSSYSGMLMLSAWPAKVLRFPFPQKTLRAMHPSRLALLYAMPARLSVFSISDVKSGQRCFEGLAMSKNSLLTYPAESRLLTLCGS